MQYNSQNIIISVQQGTGYGQEISHIQDPLFDDTSGFELFNLRCSSSKADLWVTFSFSLRFKLIGCASKVEIERMNSFKQMISVTFVIW